MLVPDTFARIRPSLENQLIVRKWDPERRGCTEVTLGAGRAQGEQLWQLGAGQAGGHRGLASALPQSLPHRGDHADSQHASWGPLSGDNSLDVKRIRLS